ncbi:MAG TPA: FecR family protein [Smithellaceae bacterium]|nr:FecR family protein [Smithellaceae bacterium]
MKKSMQILVGFVFLCIFAVFVYAAPQLSVRMSKGQATVTALEGTALIVCEGQKKGKSLKINDKVSAGCGITTGEKSRLELLLPDKSIVRFAENTNFNLMQADAKTGEKREIKIFVKLGKIWSNVRKALGGKSGFEVSCENAVAGVRGTVYRVDVAKDKSAVVKVYDGEVGVWSPKISEDAKSSQLSGPPKPVAGPKKVAGPKRVSMEEWIYIVKSMQQIKIKSDGKAENPEEFTEVEDKDEWVDWNKSRDNEKK